MKDPLVANLLPMPENVTVTVCPKGCGASLMVSEQAPLPSLTHHADGSHTVTGWFPPNESRPTPLRSVQ